MAATLLFYQTAAAQDPSSTVPAAQNQGDSSSQEPTAPATQSDTADLLKAHDKDLDAALTNQRASIKNQAKLRIEIEALGADRRKFNQNLIDTAGRVRDVEANIEATRARLAPLDDREASFRKSLQQRRDAMVEVLAALQRIGRQPPPALLLRPEDALEAVRSAITLGAVVPEMRAQAASLAATLSDLVRLRKEIADQDQRLTGELDQLGREQLRLSLLVDERQKKQASAQQALATERQRAADLAHRVDSIKDLIAKLESTLPPAARAAHDAAHAITDDSTRPQLAALSDPGRLAPAVAFADMRGRMHLPVNGQRIRDFGGSDGVGGTQKGLSIAAQPGAEITAPCDGWVVYAGPFRSYGQLLILNAGGGYHVLLAGMDRISVDLGQFVLTGEPIAAMGDTPLQATAATTRPKMPVLYVEFRKDGAPIDPSPWWAKNESEKARG